MTRQRGRRTIDKMIDLADSMPASLWGKHDEALRTTLEKLPVQNLDVHSAKHESQMSDDEPA